MHHQHHLLKHRGFVTKIAILVLAILFGVLVWNTTHRQTIQLASFPDAPSVYSDFPKCKSPAQISVLTSEYKLAAKLATAAGQKSYASEINKKLTTVLRSLSSAQVSLIKAQNQLDAASTTLAKANSTVADRTKALQDNTVLSKEKALKSSLASAIKVQGPASKTYNAKKSAYDAIVAKIDAITVQKDTLSKTYDDIFKVTFEERFALRDKALAVLNQFTAMPTCPKTETPNQCLDGIDNDRDAKTDCDDSECSVTQACIDKKNGIGIPTNAGMDPNNGTGGPATTTTSGPGTSTNPVQSNKKVCCVCVWTTRRVYITKAFV